MGRDIYDESYRIAVDIDGHRIVAHVPERLFADPRRPFDRPSHQTAYEGIASARQRIETAIAALARGGAPRAPFDQITLAEDH